MESVFAQRLINARKIRGVSQRELCARLDGRISSNAIDIPPLTHSAGPEYPGASRPAY